jgi:hypothetical protein
MRPVFRLRAPMAHHANYPNLGSVEVKCMSAQQDRPTDPSVSLGLIEAEPEGGPAALPQRGGKTHINVGLKIGRIGKTADGD